MATTSALHLSDALPAGALLLEDARDEFRMFICIAVNRLDENDGRVTCVECVARRSTVEDLAFYLIISFACINGIGSVY